MKTCSFVHFLTAVVISSRTGSAAATGLFLDAPEHCLFQHYSLAFFTNAGVPAGLAAIPTDRGQNNCPVIGMDAQFGPEMEPVKHWAILEQVDLAMSHSVSPETYPLAQIEEAYQNADVTADGSSSTYDVVVNNDVFFPLAIVKLLGVHTLSPEVISWAKIMVMDRLNDMIDSLQSSPNVGLVAGGSGGGGNRFLRKLVDTVWPAPYTDMVVEKLVMYDLHKSGMTMSY